MNKHAVLMRLFNIVRCPWVLNLSGLIFVNSILFMGADERLDLIKPEDRIPCLSKGL